MKKKLRTILILLLTVSMILASSITFFAEEEDPAAGEEEVVFADDDLFADSVREYPLSFSEPVGNYYKWSFPYTDEFFKTDPSVFSRELAQASLGLAICAFRNEKTDIEDQYEQFLTSLGFTDIAAFGYQEPTGENTLSGVIARKDIDGFTLIAAAPCGQGYDTEWASNFNVGTGQRHEGFQRSAEIMEAQIMTYIENRDIKENRKLWISGFSRGAAVANLTAADMMDSGIFTDVYAYLFAVPRTTRKPEKYKGIYNINGAFDLIPKIPPNTWGYGRYGTDLYTPAQETDTDYTRMAAAANISMFRLCERGFRNNPEVNEQLSLVIEFIGEAFPNPEEYGRDFQGILMKNWTRPGIGRVIDIVIGSFRELARMDKTMMFSSNTFIDYLSYVLSSHMQETQEQIEDGSWDPDRSLTENIMLEHLPSTYLAWMFADVSSSELLNDSITTRKISLYGITSITIMHGDAFAGGIGEDGKYLYPPLPGPSEAMAYARRIGDVIVVYLPDDSTYSIRFSTGEGQYADYHSQLYSADRLGSDDFFLTSAIYGEGEYELVFEPGQVLVKPQVLSGRIQDILDFNIAYTARYFMNQETESAKYIHLYTLAGAGAAALLLVVIVILVCIVIAVKHRRRIKEGHPPYSDKYVIIPHLIVAADLCALMQFLTRYMYRMGSIRGWIAGVSMFVLCLLALRGTMRNRKRRNYVLTALIGSMGTITALYYRFSIFSGFSIWQVVSFTGGMIILAVLAVLTFYKGKKRAAAKENIEQDVKS